MVNSEQQDGHTRQAPSARAAFAPGRQNAWVIFGATALALLVRFLTLPAMTRDGALRLVSMDDYGHLRRAMATLVEFPRVPAFDPYLHHPEGAIWIWPPGFDFALAAIGRLMFGRGAELGELTLVAALVPPVVGALGVWPLFAFCRSAIGSAEARWAALFYALIPAAVVWSSFGRADQHCAEALALILVLAAFSRLFGFDWSRGFRARSGAAILCAALALWTAVLVWQGAVFLAPIVAAAAVVGRRQLPTAAALLVAAGWVAVFSWSYPGPVTYVSFGRFQPLFLLLWAGLLALAAAPRWGLAAATVAGLAAAFSWPPISDGVRHLLSATSSSGLAAGGLEAYPKEWLQLIFEYRSLFHSGASGPLAELSGGLLAVVPVILWWAYRLWTNPSERSRLALPLIALLAVSAMALSQRRFVYYASVLVAVALAVALVEIARRVPWGRWVAAGLVILAFAPSVPALVRQRNIAAAAGEDVFRTLEALGTLDPPSIGLFRPGQAAPGEIPGVLAPWSLGHLVTLLTERPAVADNFGYGFERQSWIFTAPPEADGEVARRLEAWNCRYLITADLDPVLAAYAQAAGHESVLLERMLVNRLHKATAPRPVEFLELTLVSETGRRLPDGTFVPLLKVFRIRPAEPQQETQNQGRPMRRVERLEPPLELVAETR